MYGMIHAITFFLKIEDTWFLKYIAIHPLVAHLAILKAIGS